MTDKIIQKKDSTRPTKIVVMCCDDPQDFYLIEELKKHFTISGIILETNEEQMKWLWKKGRYKLWGYRFYHSKRRKLTGDSAFRKKSFPIKQEVALKDIPTFYSKNINTLATANFLANLDPDLTICCGTMYIGKRIRKAGNCLINLHGGILPDYKGSHCTFFALYEQNYDKIGMTIHMVAKKLDGGSYISHVKPNITIDDNDESLYCKAFILCTKNLLEIIQQYDNGKPIIAKSQVPIDKKTFSHTDRTPFVELKHFFNRRQRKKLIEQLQTTKY